MPIEIMAPAGSMESLIAAVQAGANAIYFGVEQLNMRARSANNFTLKDLPKISKICRQAGVKTYVTLNTIIYDSEIPLMQQIVNEAAKNQINAIIASDISVMEYARSIGLEIHISTQCNITNIEAVKFYSRWADVMVLARELNLAQVAHICKEIKTLNIIGPSGKLIEIELFAHGALCMAISGRCYISTDTCKAPANRGACLQLCRRPYQIKDLDGGVELSLDNKYILSPKDLCTIDFLDKIIEAGVSVLKIEGRGRSPEYVKTVTTCYKEAIAAIESGNYNESNIQQWVQKLKAVYNRGFWEGYYLGRKTVEWSGRYGSQATQKKIHIGKINNYFSNLKVAEVKIETGSLKTGDKVVVIGPTTGVIEFIIEEIRVDLQITGEAQKGEICSIPVTDVLRKNDKLYVYQEINFLEAEAYE